MIGDWVLDTRTNKPIKIKEINAKTGEGLESILLTHEILIKNGFKNDFCKEMEVADSLLIRRNGYTLKGKIDRWQDFSVTYCDNYLDVVTVFYGEFHGERNRVHELQQALRLCGIKKKIVL